MSKQGVVLELQQKALDQNIPVSTLLRLAKVIAVKLGLHDALGWIEGELNGYMDQPAENVPHYRVKHGEVKALNPYAGWQPLGFKSAERAEIFSTAHLGVSIGEMEQGHEADGSRVLSYQWHPSMKQDLMSSVDGAIDVRLELSPMQISGIFEAVRNLVLNWALELEAQGTVGENKTFSAEERPKAQAATQNFFVQNASVIGNVSDRAQVHSQQSAQINIDLDRLRDVVGQARDIAPALPVSVQGDLVDTIDEIDQELSAGAQDQTRLRSLVERAIRVCEGASGSVVATGIIEALKALL